MRPHPFFFKSIDTNQGRCLSLRIRATVGECCVLMPFAPEFNEVYKAIKRAVQGGQVCFHCSRADEFFHGGSVIKDILGAIGRAEIIIADLTTRNPNVFYELGIAHMVKQKKKVIIIMGGGSGTLRFKNDIPFDVSALRVLRYHRGSKGLEKLRGKLVRALLDVGERAWRFDVSDGKNYKKEQKIYGIDGDITYAFGLSQVEVAVGGAKFSFDVQRDDGKEVEVGGRRGVALGREIEIPGLRWKLTLVEIRGRKATFSVNRPTVQQ